MLQALDLYCDGAVCRHPAVWVCARSDPSRALYKARACGTRNVQDSLECCCVTGGGSCLMPINSWGQPSKLSATSLRCLAMLARHDLTMSDEWWHEWCPRVAVAFGRSFLIFSALVRSSTIIGWIRIIPASLRTPLDSDRSHAGSLLPHSSALPARTRRALLHWSLVAARAHFARLPCRVRRVHTPEADSETSALLQKRRKCWTADVHDPWLA